jgi:amino acid permease
MDATELKVHKDAPSRHGTVFSGYSVMTKSMVGSGILSISFACAQSGLILGTLMLLFAAGLTWLSLHVLSKLTLAFPHKEVSFYSMTEEVFPKMKWFLDVAVVIDCVGSAICFIQVMGTHLGEGIAASFDIGSLSKSNLVIILQCCMVLALFPVSVVKEITNTQVVNIVGIVCLLYVAVLAMVYADFSNVTSDLLYPTGFAKAIGAFPIMIFAFSCQQNILSVSSELKQPNMRKLDTITGSAILTGLLMYLPVMLLPFLTFGRPSTVPGTFLGLLPISDGAVIAGYICAAISVWISVALVVIPTRSSILSLMYGSGPRPEGKKELTIRVIITASVLAVTLGAAIGVGDNLSIALSFTGLLGANTCGFVMPFAMYIGHFGMNWKSVTSVSVMLMLGFCLVLYPLGITANILDIVNS